MPSIEDYINNYQRARIDVVTNPIFKKFIVPDDLELTAIDHGSGIQVKALALTSHSASKVIGKILEQAEASNVRIKYWICSQNEFHLSSKVGTPPSQLMCQLDKFLNNKSTHHGFVNENLISAFGSVVTPTRFNQFLALLVVVGIINEVFINL